MQDPFFGMVKLRTDSRQMIADAISKNKKSGEECPLFGGDDRYKVAPDRLVCGAVFLRVS